MRFVGTRCVLTSGRSPVPFQSPVTNVAQLPQRVQRRRFKVQAQPAAVKVQPSKQAMQKERLRLQEEFVGIAEPALVADPAVRFKDLEQFYQVLNLSVQLSTPPPRSSQTSGGGNGKNEDFYANVGNAIRTLREEIPLLFQRDFTCENRLPTSTVMGLVDENLQVFSC